MVETCGTTKKNNGSVHSITYRFSGRMASCVAFNICCGLNILSSQESIVD